MVKKEKKTDMEPVSNQILARTQEELILRLLD